jgi:hypothetical protein
VATFTATGFTITPSAGPNGTITPNTVQTVASGGSSSFTFAPNAGYHIFQVLVDGLNNPAAVTSGTYAFTNVTANHTIGPSFEANPAITVTVPLGTESWTTGSTQNLGWTVSSAVSTGQFGVWLVNQTTGIWYEAGYFSAVAAQTVYSPSFVVPNVPDGSYKVTVYYRTDPTQWVWLTNGISLGAATITPGGFAINTTVPNGTQNWTIGSTQALGWTVSSAVSTGQFGVWLVNQTTGTWYEAGYFSAVAAQTSYTPTFVVPTVPAGSYKAVVYYRTDPTQWVWLANSLSPSTATIGP